MLDVHIAGIGMTLLGRQPALSVKDLTRDAVNRALADAGMALPRIEAAWFSNTRQTLLEGQNTIKGQCALRSMGFSGIPIVNVENACASGSTAVQQAVAHIAAGFCDVALVVGAEKMFFPEKRDLMLKAFIGGTDIHDLDAVLASLDALRVAAGQEPLVSGAAAPHSLFMDIYSATACLHMKLYGTTMRQIAAVAAKNHVHSVENPYSQYRVAMTVDEVLNDQLVSWPLTRSMCSPISDGAAAVVLCNARALRQVGTARAVRIAGISLRSSSDRNQFDFSTHIGLLAANQAYEQAGIGPDDVDVAEVHDACSFAEIVQVENLGLVPRGEGGPAAERGETAIGSRIPVNPSGGLVSKGHPVGATGIIQLFELVQQLRGEAGRRQVENPRCAVAENGGGYWGVEEAATMVTVLRKN